MTVLTRLRRRYAGVRRDAGMATVTMLFLGMITILFAAAILGGGTVLAARTHGYDIAASAARAGAQQIDTTAYRDTGVLRLDRARAAQAAKQYLAAAGATGTVTVTVAGITVTATSRQNTPALEVFG